MIVAVADHGSISKAAAVLGVSQPSLSTQVQRIERALGFPLLERTTTGAVLTPMGRDVVTKARTVLAELADLPGLLAQPQADSVVRLRLGAPPGGLIAAMVPVINRMYDETHGPPLTVDARTEHIHAALLRQLQAATLDAVVVYEHIDQPRAAIAGVRHATVVDFEPAFIGMSERHPLAQKDVVELGELAREPWVVDPDDDIGDVAHLRKVCRVAGFEPRIAHRVTDSFVATDFVTSGQGVFLVQATAPEGKGLVVRPLEGDPFGQRIELAWLAHCPVSPNLLISAARTAYIQLVERNKSYPTWWRKHHGVEPSVTLGRPFTS